MRIKVSFDDEFEKLFCHYQEDFPELADLLGVSEKRLDYSRRSREFFSESTNINDFSIDRNANVACERGPTVYASELTKPLLKLHGLYLIWLHGRKMFGRKRANELISRVLMGDVYFHDSSGPLIQVPYCVSLSALNIALNGMPFNAQLVSRPPRHLDSFLKQVVETMFNVGNCVAGAVAMPDLFVVMSFYTKKENVSDRDIRQAFQGLVYSLNQPMRSGVQSLFSNISIYDRRMLESAYGHYTLWGEKVDFDEVERVQRICAEFVSEGVDGLPYKFPVMTANVMRGSQDGFLDFLAELNAPLGIWNVYTSDTPRLTMCCRLTLDGVFLNTYGSGDVNTGSLRVVTLNLPRLAFTSRDFNHFRERLKDLVYDACDLLLTQRRLIEERVRQNFLFVFKHNLLSLTRMFSTVGLTGVYEACCYLDGKHVWDVAREVLQLIDKFVKERITSDGVVYNVELVPAEQAAFTLCDMDRVLFGKSDFRWYSNQLVPLSLDVTMKERIDRTAELDRYLSGGCMLHLNVAERVSAAQMKKLLAYASKTTYFAVNYLVSRCENCGYVFHHNGVCPSCASSNVTRLTRVVGYFSPLTSWSSERLRDFESRRWYRLGGSV